MAPVDMNRCGKKLLGVQQYVQNRGRQPCHENVRNRKKLSTPVRLKVDKQYKCDSCSKTFRWQCHLTEHKRTHTGYKPHTCQWCGKTFRTVFRLLVHNREHTADKLYRCSWCDKAFKHLSSLKFHNRFHTGEIPYLCHVCGMKFYSPRGFKQHRKMHFVRRSYQCGLCCKIFTNAQSLHKHTRIHVGYKRYRCDICSLSFRSLTYFRQHYNIHTGDMLHQCDECGKIFCRLQSLIKHQRAENKRYTCGTCNIKFCGFSKFSSHLETHLPATETYLCYVCNQSFRCLASLHRHKALSCLKLYECSMCKKSFRTLNSFKNHQQYHMDRDEQETSSSSAKNGQLQSDQPKETDIGHGTYQLDSKEKKIFGSRSFRSSSKVNNIDSGENNDCCDLCSKSKRLSGLSLRRNICHHRYKPYKCGICDEEFYSTISLFPHMMGHMPEQLFKCHICSDVFNNLSALQEHRAAHTSPACLEQRGTGSDLSYNAHGEKAGGGELLLQIDTCDKVVHDGKSSLDYSHEEVVYDDNSLLQNDDPDVVHCGNLLLQNTNRNNVVHDRDVLQRNYYCRQSVNNTESLLPRNNHCEMEAAPHTMSQHNLSGNGRGLDRLLQGSNQGKTMQSKHSWNGQNYSDRQECDVLSIAAQGQILVEHNYYKHAQHVVNHPQVLHYRDRTFNGPVHKYGGGEYFLQNGYVVYAVPQVQHSGNKLQDASSQTECAWDETPMSGSKTQDAESENEPVMCEIEHSGYTTVVGSSQTVSNWDQTLPCGNKTLGTLDQSPLCGSQFQDAGDQTQLAGNQTPHCENQTQLAGNQTQHCENQTQLAGNQTQHCGTQTQLAGNRTQLPEDETPYEGGHTIQNANHGGNRKHKTLKNDQNIKCQEHNLKAPFHPLGDHQYHAVDQPYHSESSHHVETLADVNQNDEGADHSYHRGTIRSCC